MTRAALLSPDVVDGKRAVSVKCLSKGPTFRVSSSTVQADNLHLSTATVKILAPYALASFRPESQPQPSRRADIANDTRRKCARSNSCYLRITKHMIHASKQLGAQPETEPFDGCNYSETYASIALVVSYPHLRSAENSEFGLDATPHGGNCSQTAGLRGSETLRHAWFGATDWPQH